ncbi:MAG: hypothetical protein M9909_09160 [Thermomicrobiales bacterium]|nr:hypothetical protein [Thermomicrobiales bacterium]
MNVPTPLNDNARDDRFDRGLEQLLQANPTGLDEIEPELRDITVQMVRLANDAGWIGADPGEHEHRSTPRWRDLKLITNAIAAAALIGVVLTLAWFGVQYLNDNGGHYGSAPTMMPEGIPEASCDRIPRSDTEIAAIVRSSGTEVAPFQASRGENDFYNGSIRLARDWNLCLLEQNWARAVAYESDYFIWLLGQHLYPDGTAHLTNAEIARGIMDFHHQLTPMPMASDITIGVYTLQNIRALGDGSDNVVIGLDAWIVPIRDADWVIWPIVFAVEWDGTQWMIVSTSQDSVPDSLFKPNDNASSATPEAATIPPQ